MRGDDNDDALTIVGVITSDCLELRNKLIILKAILIAVDHIRISVHRGHLNRVSYEIR